jgi:hypothetical protein
MSTKPPRKSPVRFELEWTSEAWAELRTLSAPERRPVMEAAARLAVGDAVESGNAIRGLRAPGDHRLLYRVVDPLPGRAGARPRVQILCAIVTGASGAAVARPRAGELSRRGAIVRKIGGGIPHEVVRRAWLLELRREVRSRARPVRTASRLGGRGD